MAACFGVHLGNTSICLGISRDGKTEIIANDSGDRVTPAAAVHNGQELEVCVPLRRTNLIANNKRLFEANPELIPEPLDRKLDCKIVFYENKCNYEVCVENEIYSFTPDHLATKFYGKMFSIATHAACTEEELKAVIAVPSYWSKENQKRAITAAELAGFNILQAITEPAAALLAYNFDESDIDKNVLIYRLGGTSCDVTLAKVSGGIFSIENEIHQPGIGGQYITKDLADYIAAEFYQKWKLDPQENKRAMQKLFHYANDCKHVLSTLNSSHVFIESLYDGTDWSQYVSRARFENIISSKLEAYLSPIRKLLADTKNITKIHNVILCGGSMKIPKLQVAVSDLFPDATVLSNLSPDEVISLGCAKQASLLLEYSDMNFEDASTTIDCIDSSIFLRYMDKKICLFPAGSPAYSEVELPLACTEKMDKIDLEICEGENNVLSSRCFPVKSKNPKIHAILYNDDLTVDVI